VGISIGGVDVASEIVELHFQLHRTQKLLEILINKNPQLSTVLNSSDTENAEHSALEFVKKKFPDMGIQKKA
jgi:hypothetical protein